MQIVTYDDFDAYVNAAVDQGIAHDRAKGFFERDYPDGDPETFWADPKTRLIYEREVRQLLHVSGDYYKPDIDGMPWIRCSDALKARLGLLNKTIRSRKQNMDTFTF